MMFYQKASTLVLILIFSPAAIFTQTNGKSVTVSETLKTNNSNKTCKVFINGKLIDKALPIYPEEAKAARLSGKVEVIVGIDEKGNVKEIENITGEEIFKKAASEAAMKSKFIPPNCDGQPSTATGAIIYNFSLAAITESYYIPTKIEDLPDVSTESNFYEALVFLTENYKIAFAYSDKKYHPEMPLNKGDFVHFLAQTIELLDNRAKISNKNIKETSLYKDYNPNNLEYAEVSAGVPYANSYRILLSKYRIVLAEKDGTINGKLPMTESEVIETWRSIFGEEAVPVNFVYDKKNDKVMSRGDFAIFLHESLGYLTYKVLP